MTDDYEHICAGEFCRVIGSPNVRQELAEHAKKRNSKDVKKIGLILERLACFGLQALNNKEQFRREGKYSSGRKDGSSVVVYAAKSFQLRVYGGFVGDDVFACVEATVKKTDKADPAVLNRVARVLGEMQ